MMTIGLVLVVIVVWIRNHVFKKYAISHCIFSGRVALWVLRSQTPAVKKTIRL